jgi:hypothetical protein
MAVDAMSIALSHISSPRNAERADNDKNSSIEMKLPVVGTLLLRYEPQASTECKSRPRGEAERTIPLQEFNPWPPQANLVQRPW